MSTPSELILCADHQWSPWSVVCVHLVTGQSRDWVPIPSDSAEVEFDWACPACEASIRLDQADVTNLRAICIHCVRLLRREYDGRFED